jgi:hypothetical protein
MAYGDHVRVWRGVYWHHAIDMGDGTVIHYWGLRAKEDAFIQRSPFDDVMHGDPWEIVQYGQCDAPEVVVARAVSLLGKRDFNLAVNNCECFAHWCKAGRWESAQADTAVTAAGGSVATGAFTGIGIAGVGAAGTSLGLSGAASTMSGLSAVGSVVGGGAVAGVGVLAAAPTTAATVAMLRRLRDDPTLTQEEREARQAGRAGTLVGAGGGVLGSMGVLYFAGTVGYSAVGITTGLAAVGGIVGGGMIAGAAILVGAPALVTAGLGYLGYRLRGGRG